MTSKHESLSRQTNLERRLRTYLASPWMMLKDVILICLAIPGLATLLSPSIACDNNISASIQPQSNYNTPIKLSTNLGKCNCGSSLAEARAMGCKYDSLASAWLPTHCRDEQLTAEFERSGDGDNGQWRYFLDQNMTQEISLTELAERGDDRHFRFYSTYQWHVMHCFFYWRKQYRALESGVVVEHRYNTEDHISHCGSIFLDRVAKVVMAGVVLDSD